VRTDDAWEEEGRRVAPLVSHVFAAVVVGANPDHAARVALGIARAESALRRVALGDLVGDLGPLYTIAGGEDAFGLTDCFRDARSLNEVARQSPECQNLFILPAGTPPVATADVFAHERWSRLVHGFAEAGALLLLVAPLDAPGLDALVAVTGGIVAVDVPARRVRQYPVLASVVAPSPSPPSAAIGGGHSRWRLLSLGALGALGALGTLVVAVGAVAWGVWPRHRAAESHRAAASPPAVSPPAAALPSDAPQTTTIPGAARADTVQMRERVSPGDSLRSAPFAIEVVAANTLAGANSFLQDAGEMSLPASTVAPVQLGGGSLWYKVMVGAWRSRGGADSLLGALRARKVVRRDAGVVVRVPYALLVADKLDTSRAKYVLNSWRARGISAYALVQEDGSVRVFAGAFETAAQAAPLAVSLRDAGAPPVVVLRTGRPF
jgi:hypothetical protein